MRKGFACGVFDVYHPGHVLMLEECRRHCDHLTVAVNEARHFDPVVNPQKRGPIFTLEERLMVLRSVRYIDTLLTYGSEEELMRIMESGGFHVRFLGDDYRGRPITAAHAIPHIHYIDRGHGYSTTAMVQRIRGEANP